MKSIVITQAGQIQKVTGSVTAKVNGDVKSFVNGEFVPANTNLSIDEASFVELLLEDGSIISSSGGDSFSVEQSTEDSIADLEVLSEIEQIQSLIAAGEDPTEGPDTAAGTPSGSEGSSGHVSISRSGAETLADASYTTSGLNESVSDTTPFFDSQSNATYDDPSQLENDSNSIAEDEVATGNVLDNDSDIDSDLTVVSFEVNGQTVTAGTTVQLDNGTIVINEDGSYTFTPDENWNGNVPVITYTTNTGLTATLTIEVTPVDDPSQLVND
ncbi:retention module-containing protein, partial [Shewanella sp. c952]|uniref:retention module-containing protein n=1 Tax=Shewanella sp. c952 TaxID=2815913 RepID=UPI001C7DF326